MSPHDLLARLEGWGDVKLLDCGSWPGYEDGRKDAFKELLEYVTILKGEL